jgi:hypothetical protein
MNKPVFLHKIVENKNNHYSGWYLGESVSFYVSSAIPNGRPETMVFLADHHGKPINWCDISMINGYSHEHALEKIGFYIVDKGSI